MFALQAQPVTDYTYKLDNGIVVKSENCWNQVWIQQSYEALNSANQASPLAVNIRCLGDLVAGSSFKLMNEGKEVKLQGTPAGNYSLKLNLKLTGKPGTLSMVVNNIVIKPMTKTSIAVTLYDYQVKIDETTGTFNGLSLYDSQIERFKGNSAKDAYSAVPSFYEVDKHDKKISPDESESATKGKIKPGKYDVLITIPIYGQNHKLWLNNFTMKPDVSYKITLNLNAGGIIYTGTNKDVKNMYLYPAGTAAKQQGKDPAPITSIKALTCQNPKELNCCSPGAYDVLLDVKNGSKFEWRKNIVIQTGSRTEIK
jgi:hypothetical protein